MRKDDRNETQLEQKPEPLIAKRDFLIVQNDYRIEIKEGDDVSELPKQFLENLKTEEVI